MYDNHDALRERYRRLRAAARAVVDGAESAGHPERPLCGVEPHLIRTLRREVRGEPQPSAKLSWMSPT
jgi:hypothetical protein